jgi:plastocyanin
MTDAKSIITCQDVIACTLLLLLACMTHAAALSVTVRQADGLPLPGIVVVAETIAGYPPVRSNLKATIDQINLMFVPETLVVRSGTSVDFPNSDQVRHQVYSFSGAKTFQLPLYAGRTQPPVVFDRPGIVTLGCNIHDGMIGYLYVTDSPWYGKTDRNGSLKLTDLPAGNYTIKIWHDRFPESAQRLQQPVSITADQTADLQFQLTKPLRNARHHHGKDKQWNDY